MSGTTSACSQAKSVPVRPKPVCTSSRISRAAPRASTESFEFREPGRPPVDLERTLIITGDQVTDAQASYDENADPKRYKDGTRQAAINSNYSVGGSFDSRKLFGKGSKGDFILFKPFLWGLRKAASRIDPISLQYGQDNRFSSSGLVGRPSMKFQFGLTKDPGVETKQTAGSARRFSDSKAETYSAKSGIKFILGTKISSGYAKRIQSSVTQRMITTSVTFPNLGVNIGRLER